MRILVTGAAGYIGSYTTLKLQEEGHWTLGYDNLSKGHKDFIFTNKFIKGDVHNKNLLTKILKKYDIEAVMHFAAFIEAGESMENPKKYFYNNTVGTISLLDAIVECNVKYFIFSSTAALYGNPDKLPIEEDAPLVPTNPYGESKLLIEKILNWYSQIYDFKYISLRYFNAAGADSKLRTGELHNPETHLIPLAVQTALGKREALYIYGTDYRTKDGTCIRDYIYVEDLADAHIKALNYLVKKNKSDVFNLGSGNGWTVKEVVETVKKVTGKNFKVIETSRRKGDPEILIASSKKIEKVLNWKPQNQNLEKIIETSVNFYEKYKKI